MNLNFPLRHISIRVPWHDAGWNGTVCKCPARNTACLKLADIAEKKKRRGRRFSNVSQQNILHGLAFLVVAPVALAENEALLSLSAGDTAVKLALHRLRRRCGELLRSEIGADWTNMREGPKNRARGAKHLLRADRQRQIPPSFSWVDHSSGRFLLEHR